MRRYSSNYSFLDVIKEIEDEESSKEDMSTYESNFRRNKKQPSSEQTENVVKLRLPKRLTGIGSNISGFSGYSFSDDTTTFDTQELRDSFLRNPVTYRYATDIPRAALQNWKIITKDYQEPDNEGLRAIQYWKALFEADPNQMNLNELFIFADQYFRLYGEVAFELRFARNPYLTTLGFVDGEMLKSIDLISPMLIPQSEGVQYDVDGNITGYKIYNSQGSLTEIIEPDEVKRIIYFHNQPPNEHRGISRLRPLMSLLDGYDDLRELEIMMMEVYANPLEFITINEEGLSATQVGKIRDDLYSDLMDMLTQQRRILISNSRVDFKMIGAEGKNLDVHVLSDRLKGDVYQGLGIPIPFIEAEGSTKSTVEVQNHHFIKSQEQAQDQAFAKKLSEQYIFPIVLREMRVDLRLMPTLYFPLPYTGYDALTQAQSDEIYINVIGDSARRHVMEREGFIELPGDKRPQSEQKTDDSKALYEYINGYDNKHIVTDKLISKEGEKIARRN